MTTSFNIRKWILSRVRGMMTLICFSLTIAVLYCLFTSLFVFNFFPEIRWKYMEHTKLSIRNTSLPLIVLGMLSPFSNTKYRNTQRSTWIATMRHLEPELPFRITYKFLIDWPTNDTIFENEKYNDIVFLNATSKGRGVKFGEKMYLWFKYIYTNFPDVLLGAKVDDDTFLCVPQIFLRLDQLKSATLYYGWAHGIGKKINANKRIDEMFVILGRDLIERIAIRNYCTGPKCNATDLVDTNFGGTSLGTWLSIYTDIDYRPDNDRIIHMGRGKEAQIRKYVKPDFCSKYVINHKSSHDMMTRLHKYNTITPSFHHWIK